MSYDFQKFGYCWTCSDLFERKIYTTPEMYYCDKCRDKSIVYSPVIYPVNWKNKSKRKKQMKLIIK